MRIGSAVRLKKTVPPQSYDASGIGFVTKKPYALVQQTGTKKNAVLVETKAVDVLFGLELIEGIPVNFLEII